MKQQDEQKQYEYLTTTPVSKLVIQLGIPTTVSMLVTNIYNMADTYFVGKIGTSASGAVGIVFGLMAIIQAIGFMFGHGGGSVISRRLGAKDTEHATCIASTSFFLSVLFGILIEVFGFIFLTPFMRILGSTDTILPYAKQYASCILTVTTVPGSGTGTGSPCTGTTPRACSPTRYPTDSGRICTIIFYGMRARRLLR